MVDQFKVPEASDNSEYVYRWCNTDERAMRKRRAEGYETVIDAAPELQLDPNAPAPPGGVTRRRGSDLILCRIKRTAYEENIVRRNRENKARQQGAIDAAVDQINEAAESAVRAAGHRTKGLAFRTSADDNLQPHMSK